MTFPCLYLIALFTGGCSCSGITVNEIWTRKYDRSHQGLEGEEELLIGTQYITWAYFNSSDTEIGSCCGAELNQAVNYMTLELCYDGTVPLTRCYFFVKTLSKQKRLYK